jgi:hypothetical protein
MAAKIREGIPEFMTSVTVCLRRNFGIKRLQAEWLCYRLCRNIMVMHHEGYAPIIVAERLATMWLSLYLDREFHALYVALVCEEEPKENIQCLPVIDSPSGTPSVPNGTKEK